MTSSALVELLQLFIDSDLEIWLDEGWGVDALLGVQTRPHKDVDLIVRIGDLGKLREILGTKGSLSGTVARPRGGVLGRAALSSRGLVGTPATGFGGLAWRRGSAFAMKPPPNKRLKLTGVDCFKGSGVLCP